MHNHLSLCTAGSAVSFQDLGIIDDNEYLHRQQEIPEKKKNSSLVVNIWDYVEGNLKPAGQKKIPPGMLQSGNRDRVDFDIDTSEKDKSDVYHADLFEELFDNNIPRQAAINHPVEAYGVGNKQPTFRPATSPRPKQVTTSNPRPVNFPFSAPFPIQTETHSGFSRVGTFSTPATQPPRSPVQPEAPYGTPLRHKASLSPPVAIASIFGLPMNITFIQVSFLQQHSSVAPNGRQNN